MIIVKIIGMLVVRTVVSTLVGAAMVKLMDKTTQWIERREAENDTPRID